MWAPRVGLEGGKSRPHRDLIPDRPARSSVVMPTELPGPQSQSDIIANANGFSDKVSFIFLSEFKQISNEWTNFSENEVYEISAEIFVWNSRCTLRTDALQTDTTTLPVAFCNFFLNAP